MKDMTCSFAAAWVRKTRAARNAEQPTTPWTFRAHGVWRGKAGGTSLQAACPHPGSKGSLQLQPAARRTGAWLARTGRCKAGIDCDAVASATGLRAGRTDRKPCDPLIPYRAAWARSSPSEQIASKAPAAEGCCWWHSPRCGPSEFARVAQPNFGSSATRVPVLILGV